MSSFSIIPIVSVKLQVFDVWSATTKPVTINNILPDGTTIRFTPILGRNPNDIIKGMLKPMVMDRLNGMINYSASEIAEPQIIVDGSKPLMLELPDNMEVDEWFEANWGKVGGDISASYRGMLFGSTPSYLQKIFLRAPPALANSTTNFFEVDRDNLLYGNFKGKRIEGSCAFQYFSQEFGLTKTSRCKSYFTINKGYGYQKSKTGKKFTCAFDMIKDYSKTDPPDWDRWYGFFKEFLDRNNIIGMSMKPIPDDADLSELDIEIIDLKTPVYSEEQEYNSMTVLEFARVCMWAGIGLTIFDDQDQMILCYDHLKNSMRTSKGKGVGGNSMVKICNNHCYVVKRGENSKHTFSSNDTFGGFYPSDLNRSECQASSKAKKFVEEVNNILEHPKTRFYRKDLSYDISGLELPEDDNERTVVIEEFKKMELAKHLKTAPPPSLDQLIEMTKSETGTTYYVGQPNLNGLVNLLARGNKCGILPSSMYGTTTNIHKATYGKLDLLAYHKHPGTGMRDVHTDVEKKCLEDLKKRYPSMKQYQIPTATQIASSVYNSIGKKNSYHSKCNDVMKSIFDRSETKADFRTFENKEEHSDLMFGLDFSKAYTNAMLRMDCRWSVFDVIDQPAIFTGGEIDKNYFYLAETKETDFPYKPINGLALYHGCLLRHLDRSKISVKYVLKSEAGRSFGPSFFVRFAMECIKVFGDGKNSIASSKNLINCYIGSMKKKQGKVSHKLTINSCTSQVQQNVSRGCVVSKLIAGSDYFITACPSTRYNYTTANPIRCQIIDKGNEMNLLLDRAVRSAINELKNPRLLKLNLLMVKTDCLFYQYPCKTPSKSYGVWETHDLDFDPKSIVEEVNKSLPRGFDISLELQSCGKDYAPISNIKDKVIYSSPEQVCDLSELEWKDNKLDVDFSVAWPTDSCSKIIKLAMDNGGLLLDGEAGTGKTHIIKEVDKFVNRNLEEYKAVQEQYELDHQPVIGDIRDCVAQRQFLDDWLDLNPCWVKKMAPTNKAANIIGGKTLHKGLGLQISDEGAGADQTVADRINSIITSIEGGGKKDRVGFVIVDEISLLSGDGWSILDYLKFRKPNIIFVLSGDCTRQIKPVKGEDREYANSRVVKYLTSSTKVELLYNYRRHRLSTEQGVDESKLQLWDDWSINPSRFKSSVGAPQTLINLSYLNDTRKKVIDRVQNSLKGEALMLKSDEYHIGLGQQVYLRIAVGTPLVCRMAIRDDQADLCKNEMVIVKSYTDKVVIVEFEGLDYKFIHRDILSKFFSGYCITIHKSQGETYDEPYTIWDWGLLCGQGNNSDNARRLRYVAQSRSTNPLEKIYYKN